MLGQVVIYALVTGTQVLFLALALHLVYLVSWVVNLALGGIATAIAYGFYFSFSLMQWPISLCVLFAISIGVLLGVLNYALNEKLTVRGQHLFAMMTSLAMALSIEAIIPMFFGSDAKSILTGVTTNFSIGEYQIPLPGLAIVVGGCTVAIIASLLYFCTPIGRKVRAISEHQSIAMSLGINQSHFRIGMYVLAALIAGAIGILFGLNSALTPTMGFNLVAMAFMALLVGGASDLRGVIVASFLITIIPELIIGLTVGISASWRLPIVFLVAALSLLMRPEGLLSRDKRLS